MSDITDIVSRLRRTDENRGVAICSEAADTIAQLRKERDEARRSCCEYAAIIDGADTDDGIESGRFYEIAMMHMKSRGWDCFKEDGK